MKSKTSDVLGFGLAFLLCFAVAGLGGFITAPEIHGWHARLNKPIWNPPNLVFRPVWTALYLLMAVAAGLIWRQRARGPVTLSLVCFLIQLLLNLGWTLLFFGAHQIGWASWEIILLDISVVATILAFWGLSKLAAFLLIPYLAWLGFASVLCWEIWRINP